MISAPPPLPPPPPEPLSSLLPPHAASASAVAVMPAVAVSRRRPFLDPEFIRHLVLVQAASGRTRPRLSSRLWPLGDRQLTPGFPPGENPGGERDRLVMGRRALRGQNR